MKPFNLEEAKAGAPLITRDGQKARLICSDRKNDSDLCLVVLIENPYEEWIYKYNENGCYLSNKEEYDLDLFMAPVKKECWINLFEGVQMGQHTEIWAAEEEAKEHSKDWNGFIKTIHVEWEE